MLVTGVRAVASRAIGLIALLVLAVLALRGHIPGTGGPRAPHTPPVVAVALMPVLLLVSMVILLAGVINSQHRLPLAMPEPDRDSGGEHWRLNRLGLLILIGLAALALLLTAVVSVLLAGPARDEPTEKRTAPTASDTATAVPDTTPPDPGTAPRLSGTALMLVGAGAVALVAVAMAGLVVVAVGSRRRPMAHTTPPTPETGREMVSLAKVAEMGLAAMIAPGQDPRTAIIACYVAMERGLAQAREVAPLVSDTPSEVLARAFERGVLHDASARELVALFEEARFSPHSMLEWQRMRAEQLLRIVLQDLQGQKV
ncbi:Uncharacterised protein [Nocardia otitidiscaviarum]|uniref:Protein-glutamine gamma-glutamyltransferase-like C-terminal domain-containing protein n=1 Tax=Nocardia otitidiscaviarum TaxID=1823 RepID=A0A378YG43_9NOCA|nr:Uncharacterised protein [Nocardia otitidiscaviarum]